MRLLNEGVLPSGLTETQRERACCGERDSEMLCAPEPTELGWPVKVLSCRRFWLFGFLLKPQVSFTPERETEAQLRDVC